MKSFKYAFSGLFYTIKNERNMRVHLCFVFYVVCAGFVTEISQAQWTAVLICAGAVLALECLNTALERLCDIICMVKNPSIKIIKDASAAAVLAAALASAAVGIIVFLNREQWGNFMVFLNEKPLLMGLIALTLVPAAMFVFRGNNKK